MKQLFQLFSYSLFLCCLLGGVNVKAQSCEFFNNQSVGAWIGQEANVSVQNGALRATDRGGDSWLTNTSYNCNNINCSTICYSYDIVQDGELGNTTPVFTQIRIYSGDVNSGNGLRATFTLNQPITEQNNWVNICVPINPIAPNAPLPANTQGQWQMTNPAQWNTLVQTFVGVAFKVDVVGADAHSEDIRIDNFCITPNPPVNANFTLNTNCNNGAYSVNTQATTQGQVLNNSWTLMQTNTPNVTTGGVQVGNVQTGNTATFNNLQVTSFYYIQHSVTDLCGNVVVSTQVVPYHEIASIFNLEDENGITKTEFCYGEDIFLDGTASYGENAYKIYRNRRPIGYTPGFNQFYESPWFTNTQAGLINLSEIFANQNNYFDPGYEYQITLAIQNVAACVNWIIAVDTISVVCCEDSISAKFGYQLTQNNVIRVEETDFNTYENINATHTWTILSGPTLNGPYTYLTTFSGTSFDYAAAPGLYFVIHSVKTECGEVCYGNPVPVSKSAGDRDEICELCGIIDCDFLSKICQAPAELKGKCLSDPFNPGVIQQLLTWASVANATQYQVEVIFNSDKCCRSSNPSVTYTYNVNTNSLDLNTVVVPLGWDCLSWRVGAVCNGEETVWSEYQCFEGCKTGERTDGQQYQSPTATLTPNPATNEVTLRFENDFTGSIQLMDALGRTVETRQETTTRTVQFNLEQVSPGIYWIIARDEKGVQPYKLMKK